MASGKSLSEQRVSMYLGRQIIDTPFHKDLHPGLGVGKVTLAFFASTQPLGLGITDSISDPTRPVQQSLIVPYERDTQRDTLEFLRLVDGTEIRVRRTERAFPGCGGSGMNAGNGAVAGANLTVTFITPIPTTYFGVNLFNNSYSSAVSCTIYIEDEFVRTLTRNVLRNQNRLTRDFTWFVYADNDVYNV